MDNRAVKLLVDSVNHSGLLVINRARNLVVGLQFHILLGSCGPRQILEFDDVKSKYANIPHIYSHISIYFNI